MTFSWENILQILNNNSTEVVFWNQFAHFFGSEPLAFFFSWLHIIQFTIITFSILIITMYLPRKVETLIFLNRIIFFYLILNFLFSILDRSLRVSEEIKHNLFSVNELISIDKIFQEDSFFFQLFYAYGILMLIIFFYGVLDNYFLKNNDDTEFPLIICFLALGAFIIFHIHTLIEFFIAIEIVTLASYICIGYEKKNRFSSYASVQYFILGSLPSGMLILAFSLWYQTVGVVAFEDLDLMFVLFNDINAQSILDFLNYDLNSEINLHSKSHFKDILLPEISNTSTLYTNEIPVSLINDVTIIMGLLLFIFNLFFKLTAAPFHFWAPSVYKNGPTISVTFLSIFLKTMVLFICYKIIIIVFQIFNLIITPIFLICGIFSILVGILGAFSEKMIKPFYVYSSMGHVGFMLIGLSLFTVNGVTATFHYLLIYILSSYLMWFILVYLGNQTKYLVSLKVLNQTHPLIAFIYAILVFSMSGIPPLGGFFIKLDILSSLLESSYFFITYILFIFTVISFFYYLRLNKIIFFDTEKNIVTWKNPVIVSERLLLFSLIFIILFCYVLLVQNPLFIIQTEFSNSLL